MGVPAWASSMPPPCSPPSAGLRCSAGADPRAWVPPGDLGPQAAGSGQAGGGESSSPSPEGLPGVWSLSPLGPCLATSSHSALRPGQQLPTLTGRGVWAHTGPARLSLGSASLAETGPGHRVSGFRTLPCSATLPTTPWAPCVSPGPPPTLLVSGPLDWEPHSGQPPRQSKGPS